MLGGQLREIGDNMREWFLRSAAVRAARAQLAGPVGLAGRAVEQTQLLRDIARYVTEPAAKLPNGRGRRGVLLLLYRDLVYWALVARRDDLRGSLPDLERYGGRRRRMTCCAREARRTGMPSRASSSILAGGAVRRDGGGRDPRRRIRTRAASRSGGTAAASNRLVARRRIRLALLPASILAVVFVARLFVPGFDLTTFSPFRTSSWWSNCETDEGCNELLVATNNEVTPWVEFDWNADARAPHRRPQPRRLLPERIRPPRRGGQQRLPALDAGRAPGRGFFEVDGRVRQDASTLRQTARCPPNGPLLHDVAIR